MSVRWGESRGWYVDFSRDEIGDVLARELYLSAGLDPTLAYGAPSVAAAVLGESCLQFMRDDDLPCRSLISHSGPRWIIYLRESLTGRQLNHAIAHELGEWFLQCRGYSEPDVEALSSSVAAAICVPRAALLVALSQQGEDVAALSGQFQVSESLMVLRLAECLGFPTALITERVVLTRGGPREWPTTRRGWTWLVEQVRAHANGLALRSLGDSPERLVLQLHEGHAL
ncbi:MAG TPA: ImmA/IrrE family metallo-endopeptidase [Polyangiaceae bacterium]|nr:ImmA/IrrE family metallo-endopeptidase [Polyangiaceae bacterium]